MDDDTDEPTAISLFAGAGGADVGLERAGWRVVAATDFDRDCIATLRASQRQGIAVRGRSSPTHLEAAHLIEADVAEVTAADLRPSSASSSWRPDLLVGGPPCQPWSSAGLQRGLGDPRGRLFEHMVRLTAELQPRLVLFENVRGLLTAVGPSGRPGEVVRRIQTSFEQVGYATRFATLNAADYGAAQRRVRLFMIASRDLDVPSFPEPTHARATDGALLGLKPWVSLAELLASQPAPDPSDVVRPTAARADALGALEPGTGLRTGGRVEANRPGGHWGYRQDCFVADTTLPARTIRAASTPDWLKTADGLRRLTWRECAALQGFPAEWAFHGTVASRFRQIGNAVQADVAEAIGSALLAHLHLAPARRRPRSAPWPHEFERRIRYTAAEHRTNGAHRVRVRVATA